MFGQDLSKVHSVYLMPMSQGLDQYLANALTREHVFQVVTAPKMADALLTDRIGEAFEDKLADLAGAPAAAESKAAEKDDQGKDAPGSALGNPLNKLANPASVSSLRRGKGTVFLVDPKSHRVLWSAYRPPKGSGSDELNRTASDIVSRLKRDLKRK